MRARARAPRPPQGEPREEGTGWCARPAPAARARAPASRPQCRSTCAAAARGPGAFSAHSRSSPPRLHSRPWNAFTGSCRRSAWERAAGTGRRSAWDRAALPAEETGLAFRRFLSPSLNTLGGAVCVACDAVQVPALLGPVPCQPAFPRRLHAQLREARRDLVAGVRKLQEHACCRPPPQAVSRRRRVPLDVVGALSRLRVCRLPASSPPRLSLTL